MREIKFRGKRIDNGEWVYGGLLQSEIDVNKIAVKCQIHERFADSFSITANDVDPKSVGEFTGLKDKNGKEIYEGDIVRRYSGYLFKMERRTYSLGQINQAKAFGYDWHESDEVIGNIYEHQHLLQTATPNS